LAFFLVVWAALTATPRIAQAVEPEDWPAVIELGMPFGVEWGDGRLWLTSITDESIVEVMRDGQQRIVAGSQGTGLGGDGGRATAARFNWPHEVRVDAADNLYIADTRNHVIRKVDAATGKVRAVAGDGKAGFADGVAAAARFDQPHSVVLMDDQTLLVADTKNHRIRRIDLATGRVTTFCGDGQRRLPEDGQSRVDASLFGPRSLAVDRDGIWIALREGNSIWRIDRKTDRLVHVAGSGAKGYQGDGGSAKTATFNGPKGLAIDGLGRVLVVDTENHCVRRIDVGRDFIETVLGGRRAAETETLLRPHGIACFGAGDAFFVADSENDRVLRWPVDGTAE